MIASGHGSPGSHLGRKTRNPQVESKIKPRLRGRPARCPRMLAGWWASTGTRVENVMKLHSRSVGMSWIPTAASESLRPWGEGELILRQTIRRVTKIDACLMMKHEHEQTNLVPLLFSCPSSLYLLARRASMNHAQNYFPLSCWLKESLGELGESVPSCLRMF